MSIKYKKWKIVLGVVCVLLILINPSLKDFKEHTGDSGVTKKMNLLIASIYEDGQEDYIGIAMNFIKVTSSASATTSSTATPQYDSTATMSSKSNSFISDTSAFTKPPEGNIANPLRKKSKKDPLILDSTDSIYTRH